MVGGWLPGEKMLPAVHSRPQKTVLPSEPAREYYNALQAGFDAGSANPPADLLHALGGNDGIQLDAPPTVAANFAMVNGVPHTYFANFGGLVPGKLQFWREYTIFM